MPIRSSLHIHQKNEEIELEIPIFKDMEEFLGKEEER